MRVCWRGPLWLSFLLQLTITGAYSEDKSGYPHQQSVAFHGEISSNALDQLLRAHYLELISVGDLETAKHVALRLYPTASQDKLFLAELGLIHSFLGDHSSARRYCSEAYVLDSEASLILSCLGLAFIYLPGSAETGIRILRKSIDRFTHEQERIKDFIASLGDDVAGDDFQIATAAGVLTSTAFVSTLASLEFNLLNALSVHRQHRECIEWFIQRYGLPGLEAGAAHILTFAVVKWSEGARPDIDALEISLRAQGQFAAPPGITLWNEVRRVQEATADSLSTAQFCMAELRGQELYAPALNTVLLDFMHVFQQRQRVAEDFTSDPNDVSSTTVGLAGLATRGVSIIQQYYKPGNARAQDINVALWRNLQNDYITDIYLLNEEIVSLRGFPNAHKIHQIVIGERLTFRRAFTFANEHLQGRTVILANSDIFFDGTLFRLSGADDLRVPPLRDTRTVLALLKWKFNNLDESMSIDLRTDSQDAWVFQPPLLSAEALPELDFYMGLPRCDNRLVHVLQQHNYTVLDPAFAVHAVELDTTERAAQIYNTERSITGPMSTLLLSDQFEF